MANPMKTIKTAIFRVFLGAFLLPAGAAFSQSLPAQTASPLAAARSRLNALSRSLQAKPPEAAGLDEWTNAIGDMDSTDAASYRPRLPALARLIVVLDNKKSYGTPGLAGRLRDA